MVSWPDTKPLDLFSICMYTPHGGCKPDPLVVTIRFEDTAITVSGSGVWAALAVALHYNDRPSWH
jgi:hypothetical protein